ncbi:MAG: hypothetical protein NC180_04665 [Muribaculaceae bacterium]|nr:hypothetical protein [Roseburia sp.]MCM1430302.1 hypothetical protein [Muribaculaceae bacterium]MCM1492502.1 hypothetical protein [Muribaculaceae bacterium]
MKLLERLFRSRRKNKYEREEYREEAAGTHYAQLEEEKEKKQVKQARETPRPRTKKSIDAGHDVIALCEQMIDISRELEDTRAEYQIVTNYLNDIQTIENMTAEEKAPLVECATHMVSLEQERTDFLKTERHLPDTQFAQLQAEETQLPGVIKRLKSNETYLDAIRKDMSYLEGEKLQWAMQKSEGKEQQKTIRRLSVYLLVIYATLEAFLLILTLVLKQNTQIPMLLGTGLAAILGVFLLVRYQDAGKEIRQADVNRNHAITLENHVKIKYVNIKNAVDYTCEKYHTKNSRDLAYMFELYQQEMREREKFRRNNDNLDHYTRELVLTLQEAHFYDAKIWASHANAILDPREMVELKHDLLTRRQKLRARIEYNINTITDMKKEVMGQVNQLDSNGPQVQQIIRKLEEINASL